MKFSKTSLAGLLPVVVASAIGIFLFLWFKEKNAEPPIYHPVDLNPLLVDESLRTKSTDHRIGPFNLINQYGDSITANDFDGKIFVADFFFTRCPSICPVMTENMEKIQQEFINQEKVSLLSISVTPDYDSVGVLETYAHKNKAIPNKWHICTGNKRHIYNLARKQFFAVTDEGDGMLQDFVHTPNFVLIDTEKRIRGIYDGTKDEEMVRLIRDMKYLLNR